MSPASVPVLTTRAEALAFLRLGQLALARQDFSWFLLFCITEDADGYAVPVPIDVPFGQPDPLAELIASGECKARPEAWPHVREIAEDWQSGNSFIYLKSRQMMFTWLASCYLLYRAMQRGNAFSLSQGQDYADKVIERIRYVYERLPRELKARIGKKNNTSELSFTGAGSVQSFPATMNAVRSLAGKLMVMDEMAFMPYAAELYRAAHPALSGGDAQEIIVSTANGPFGPFKEKVDEAREGRNNLNFRFYPWSTRPDHDKEWYQREMRAFGGALADFRRENPETIDDAFAQLSGVVYPSWNPAVHVAVAKVPFEQCRIRGGGVDWGGSPGNPNAAVVIGVTEDGHVHQYDEYVSEGEISIENMGAFFYRWRQKAPFAFVECDWQNDTGMRQLRKLGLPARRAIKRRDGIDLTDFLLRNNRLTIDPACTRSIEEFYGYRWREARDPNSKERYATSTPVDHHADLLDSRRYFLQRVASVLGISGNVAQVSAIGGRPLARSAV